jgi:spermidine synthase
MRPLIKGNVTGLRSRASVVIVLLFIGIIKADSLTALAEDQLFADDIIYARNTPYQRIVITRGRAGFQLFLNGNLQFSSADEYRYHEALVHPAMMLAQEARRVLVLGGGDGLAVREILKHPKVEHVTLVDLDAEMTKLSTRFPPLATLNNHALADSRVQIVNQDAMIWLEEANQLFDVAILDFPDPNTFALGKLYTTRFYRLLKAHLTPDAAIGIQCTSPLFARSSYWCIIRTLEAAGLNVRPYQTSVPSFGIWGFALASTKPFHPPVKAPANLKFLDDAAMASIFVIPADLSPVDVEINRLDNQALVRYYETEWRKYE